MRYVALTALNCCLLAFLALFIGSARAGDYYDSGYHHGHDHGSYSSDCCYRRVVHHETSAHYEPTYSYHDHHGYGHNTGAYYSDYNQPHYSGGYGHAYHDVGYDHSYHGGYGHAYYGSSYGQSYYGQSYYGQSYYGHDGYGHASYGGCGRIAVDDGRGGWVWAGQANCY